MQEYGGYIELDTYMGKEYYEDLVPLNCGRSCLKVLIETKGIRKLFLPYFLCETVRQTCELCQITYEHYSISSDFKPMFDEKLTDGEWLYIVNYYGQLTDDFLSELKSKYDYIIVDNVQAFFRKPLRGIDTIYSARKFFGVADGAYLATDVTSFPEYERDISYERMNFILGRFERPASDFYPEYVRNNELFNNESVKRMSLLTHNLLRAINYGEVSKKRTQNFEYVEKRLGKRNSLSLQTPEGAFAYPFLIEDGSQLRNRLQKLKIYIPILWPEVLQLCDEDTLEFYYARNILPLPIDQRYSIEDMDYICELIEDNMA